MPRGLPFQFDVPITMWMDKAAPPGRQRRFGGLMTTDGKDRQQETVIQKGLDFQPFLDHGWFNDNHSKETDGIVGFPDKASLYYYQKGDKLPNGVDAPNNGHWAEGYMLDNDRGTRLWDTAQSLAKAGEDRRLGFSVEGGIQKRQGKNNKVIAKATVKNVAITACPVNVDTRMETLAKSLEAVEAAESPEELWKALGMGTPASPGDAPVGPQSGDGAGQVLTSESLETDKRKDLKRRLAEKEKSQKSLTDVEAIELVKARFPDISLQTAGRIVDVARRQAALAAS